MYLAALGNAIEAQLSLDSVHLFVVPLFHANSWIFPYAVTAIAGIHRMKYEHEHYGSLSLAHFRFFFVVAYAISFPFFSLASR